MTADEQPASRREVLAFIALQDDLPMPRVVDFHPNGTILSLRFGRLADGLAWSGFFGGATRTYVNADGRIYLDEGVINWRGFSVQLHASDNSAPDTKLDEDTTAHLREIAGGDQ